MISLVLPIYNVKTEYLKACFDSIRQQSYRDFEALMVDDGSDPFVAVVCAEYATWDPRFRYLRQENAGVCAARNAGLDAASGTYVCFIDPDDWLSERYLEVLHRAIHDEDADMAIADSLIHYGKRTVENHFLNSGAVVLQDGGKNRLLYQLFSLAYSSLHSFSTFCKNKLCTKSPNHISSFLTHGIRHYYHYLVPFYITNHS